MNGMLGRFQGSRSSNDSVVQSVTFFAISDIRLLNAMMDAMIVMVVFSFHRGGKATLPSMAI